MDIPDTLGFAYRALKSGIDHLEVKGCDHVIVGFRNLKGNITIEITEF